MISYFPKSKMAAKSVWQSNGIFLLNAVYRDIQYFIGFLESDRGSDQQFSGCALAPFKNIGYRAKSKMAAI